MSVFVCVYASPTTDHNPLNFFMRALTRFQRSFFGRCYPAGGGGGGVVVERSKDSNRSDKGYTLDKTELRWKASRGERPKG